MNKDLANKLESIKEYLKIDKGALKKEIQDIKDQIAELAHYKRCLLKIRNATDELYKSELSPEYQKKIIDVMDKYPRLNSIREAEVMILMLEANSNKEIARNLGIADKTVRFHKTNIFRRCGFRNTLDVLRRSNMIMKNELPTGSA